MLGIHLPRWRATATGSAALGTGGRRRLVKDLATALSGAGLTQLMRVRKAGATYTAGTQDTVNTNLTVQGNVLVTSGGNLGALRSSPAGRADVAGEIRTSGQVSVMATGYGKRAYYATGPVPPTPPVQYFGLWGSVKRSTWGTFVAPSSPTRTWADLQTMNGTWARAGASTWSALGAKTWAQVQDL